MILVKTFIEIKKTPIGDENSLYSLSCANTTGIEIKKTPIGDENKGWSCPKRL